MNGSWNRCARTACVLAGLLILAGSAHAQYFGQNKVQYHQHDWHSIRSDHFEVFFDAGSAVVQPGGSVRDDDVIAAADRLGLAMVFTGVRHFRH